jgi:two-component system, OmpR family, alkaline phosphatase synthesis response regulator PhoP
LELVTFFSHNVRSVFYGKTLLTFKRFSLSNPNQFSIILFGIPKPKTLNCTMRILLVEDEAAIRDMLKLNLELEGYTVEAVENGKTGLEMAQTQHFDLLILDLMLPGLDGLSIAEQARMAKPEVPILILTAKDLPSDRVAGLKKGADDYITKPFHLEEVMLRIQNLLRRSARAKGQEVEKFAFGGNKINLDLFQATTHDGREIQLTKKEAHLLKLLYERKGEVVSRQQILQTVWGYEVFPSTRTIDNFILTYRREFEPDQRNPKFFHSIRGIGYRFTPDAV